MDTKMGQINEYQKPYSITKEELDLRWKYANTNMSLETFNKRFEELKRQGKVVRDGRVIK